MESRFGHDFGRVLVHTDARAADSARSVNALAYTVGSHIVFGEGQYAPATVSGQRLLAHELTHVAQQAGLSSSVLQRAPAPAAAGIGDLQLPWTGHGASLFEGTSSNVRMLVAVQQAEEKTIRGRLGAIARRISSDNRLIKEPAFQVKACIIAPTTTRFALFRGAPVLMLDPNEASEDTVTHEMGHALFHYFGVQAASSGTAANKAGNLRLHIGDVYVRLGRTKPLTAKATLDKDEEHPVGHWMVDPTQWHPGSKAEHPWDDPDEFFASAKEAYQTDRRALTRSIEKAVKLDGAVRGPGAELLDLLDNLFRSERLPERGLPSARETPAEKALEKGTGISNVEDTLTSRADEPLGWLLDPRNRPEPEDAGPTDTIDAPRERTKHPNLVTGPGGVVEQMERRFRQRIREKALESANELP
jgi:hypothetical protein